MSRIVWSVAATGALALLVQFQPWVLRSQSQELYRAETEPVVNLPNAPTAPKQTKPVEDSVTAAPAVPMNLQLPVPENPANPNFPQVPCPQQATGAGGQPPAPVPNIPYHNGPLPGPALPINPNFNPQPPPPNPGTAVPLVPPASQQAPASPTVAGQGTPPPPAGPTLPPSSPTSPVSPPPPVGLPPPASPAPSEPVPTPPLGDVPPTSIPSISIGQVPSSSYANPPMQPTSGSSLPPPVRADYIQPAIVGDVPAAVEPVRPAKPITSPWSFQLEIVEGKNLITATLGKTVQFRVVCEKVEIQSPMGCIQASGSVKVTSQALEASSDRLIIQLLDEAVLLEGTARMTCRHEGQELDLRSDRFSLKLSDIQGKTTRPAPPRAAPATTSTIPNRPPIVSAEP